MFDFSAMFDRTQAAPQGRVGGGEGGKTTLNLDDGTPLNGKGRQTVPEGRKVMLALPGGAGYGAAADRDPIDVKRDLALGYISVETARTVYRLSNIDIASVEHLLTRGEVPGNSAQKDRP